MKSLFNVLYVLDDNKQQHELFKMSVNTLLKFNKVDNIIVVYFILKRKEIKEICSFINGVKVHYKYFDISKIDKTFPILPNTCNERLRYPSLLRWFLSDIIKFNYFWYFDTDILFNTSIRDYFIKLQNIKDIYFYAFNRKMYDRNCNYYNTDKLNGGCLYINSKEFKKHKIFDDIVNFYNKNANTIYYMNQDAYQYLFNKYMEHSKIEISDEYNVKVNCIDERFDNIKYFHFNGCEKSYMYKLYKKIIEK